MKISAIMKVASQDETRLHAVWLLATLYPDGAFLFLRRKVIRAERLLLRVIHAILFLSPVILIDDKMAMRPQIADVTIFSALETTLHSP